MPMMDWLATGDQVEWKLRDAATGKENAAIDWHFKVGDVVHLRLTNDRNTLHAMAHPIHFHGQRFLVLAPCLIFNQPMIALWILAVMTNVTALQRIADVRRQAYAKNRVARRDPPAAKSSKV